MRGAAEPVFGIDAAGKLGCLWAGTASTVTGITAGAIGSVRGETGASPGGKAAVSKSAPGEAA